MTYNMNDKLRQKIIGIKATYPLGGTQNFKWLSLEKLNKLIKNNFVNLEERQNPEAPTIREFWELLKKYPNEPVILHGYIVSPKRDDYRISIEGLGGVSNNEDFLNDLNKLLEKYPYCEKTIETDYQYCWYD